MTRTDNSRAPDYILYVEDNQDLAETTAELLENDGYRVKIAADGKEALALMEKELPALILLDVDLPGELNGLELYRAIEKKTGRKKIPFIIVTGFPAGDSFLPAHEMGGKAYFSKPFDYTKLRRRVEEIFRQQRRAKTEEYRDRKK